MLSLHARDLGLPVVPILPPEIHVHCTSWLSMRSAWATGASLAALRRPAPDCPGALAEILALPRGYAQVALEKGMPIEAIPAYLDEDLDLESEDSYVLYSDIMALAEEFMGVTGARRIGVRIERVESDNCRHFHVDLVKARLLTTYVGAGTEWLRDEDVERAALGGEDNSLVRKPGAISQVLETGWVGILKGERGRPGGGLVHRSPPLPEGAAARVLLRIDQLD